MLRRRRRAFCALVAISVLLAIPPSVAAGDAPPSPTPSPAARLSADEAATLAAKLANDECDRRFERRPFSPSQYPIGFVGDRFVWGRLDPGGEDGFSAEVSFGPGGGDPEVKCYWSVDSIHLDAMGYVDD